MLRPEVGGACKGVVVGAICVGREAVAAAVLTQHFCDYKNRGLTKQRNFFLCHYDSTAEVNRRRDCRLIEGKKALKLLGATRDARAH